MSLRAHFLRGVFGAAVLAGGWISLSASAAGNTEPELLQALTPRIVRGVQTTFTSLATGETDTRVDRLVALFVPKGTSPSALLPSGPYRVVWETSLTVPLRSEVTFSFAGTGAAQLRVNDQNVLEEKGDELGAKSSAKIRLNKGANKVVVTYQAPVERDAQFRLYWSGKDFEREPLPSTQLTCDGNALAVRTGARIRRGRELFAERHCAACHDPIVSGTNHTKQGPPELSELPPSLEKAGERFKAEWLAAWIRDPKKLRPDTTMPRIRALSETDAADLAAFLASQGEPQTGTKFDEELALSGARLFTDRLCVACHVEPGKADESPEKNRVKLAFAGAKWQSSALVEFLRDPQAHYPARKMPNFGLTQTEATALAAFVTLRSEQNLSPEKKGNAARGKTLFETSDCRTCHASGLESQAKSAPAVPDFTKLNWTRGCVAETRDEAKNAVPDYALTAIERDALRAFAETGGKALAQDSPVEYSHRQFVALRCASCHARDGVDAGYASLSSPPTEASVDSTDSPGASLDQDPPALTLAGDKLKFEWLIKQLHGAPEARARPWLKARMPGFPNFADNLARGLAAEHGSSWSEGEAKALDPAAVQIGAKLASAEGFACIACHGLGPTPALAPFGAPGVNFALTSQRLRPEWFLRWLDNPPRITPTTKMPRFTNVDGSSVQSIILAGDAHAQWLALYQYMRSLAQNNPQGK